MAPESTVSVALYQVPGVPASRLEEEFTTVFAQPTKLPWRRATIGGRPVWLTEDAEVAGDNIAWWAVDGMVVEVFGSPDGVVAAARVLP